MKILFDSSVLFSSKRGGGVYQYLTEFIPKLENLIEANNDQIKFFVLYFRNYKKSTFIDEKKVIRLKLPVKLTNYMWLNFSFPDLSWCIKDIDLFHSPHFSLPIISKAKKILTVNDIIYLKYPNYYSEEGKILNEYGYKRLLPLNLTRADHIITISHHTKLDLIDYFKVPEEKITPIHIGCNVPAKIPEENLKLLISKFGIFPQTYIYFPAGTLEPRKNIQRVVTAFKKIKPKNSPIKLVISGVGEKSWLDQNVFSEDIIFVRWDTEEERNALYQGAKFAIYPSLYEGFGIPALEALANGKALLTSNTSSLPEIAEGYALMVNPHSEDEIANGLELLLKDDNYRKKLEEKSIERAKLFSYEKMAEKTYQVYKKLTS